MISTISKADPALVARLIDTYRSFSTTDLEEEVRHAEAELRWADAARAAGNLPLWAYVEANYPGEVYLARLVLDLRRAGWL